MSRVSKMLRAVAATVLAAALAAGCGDGSGPDGHVTIVVERVVDLGVYAGDESSHANAVNAEGWAVGYTNRGGNIRAALWSPDGDVSLVDSGGNCTATGINTARWVVGQCSMRAVQWRQPHQRIVLEAPTVVAPGGGVGLNAVGQAVGRAMPCHDCAFPRATVWETDGTPRYLEPLDGDAASTGWAINALGEVVGESVGPPDGQPITADWVERAVWWRDGAPLDLGTLRGYPASQAVDLNDHGVVVANACGPRCEIPTGSRAFVWEGGAITRLGASGWSSGRAINNHGWVVGMNDDGPWVWVDGTTVELPVLPGATSCDVADINDAGHIVGGCVAGAQRAVMWTIRVEQGS